MVGVGPAADHEIDGATAWPRCSVNRGATSPRRSCRPPPSATRRAPKPLKVSLDHGGSVSDSRRAQAHMLFGRHRIAHVQSTPWQGSTRGAGLRRSLARGAHTGRRGNHRELLAGTP